MTRYRHVIGQTITTLLCVNGEFHDENMRKARRAYMHMRSVYIFSGSRGMKIFTHPPRDKRAAGKIVFPMRK